MQLVILTNNGTSSKFKALNEELKLSSFRLQKLNKNEGYRFICEIEIRGRYERSKTQVDEEVVDYMQYQFRHQLMKKNNALLNSYPDYHKCLHVYAHDGTLGLLYSGPVPQDRSKAVLRAPQFTQVIVPYLAMHGECTKIKLHVCFSGCDYDGLCQAYGEQVKDELERYMNLGKITQKRIVVEATNGWSILGHKNKVDQRLKRKLSHCVLPKNQLLRDIIHNSPKADYQELIFEHGVDKSEGKPQWIAEHH